MGDVIPGLHKITGWGSNDEQTNPISSIPLSSASAYACLSSSPVSLNGRLWCGFVPCLVSRFILHISLCLSMSTYTELPVRGNSGPSPYSSPNYTKALPFPTASLLSLRSGYRCRGNYWRVLRAISTLLSGISSKESHWCFSRQWRVNFLSHRQNE